MNAAAVITARWFDGQHGLARPVEVRIEGGQLHFGDRQMALADVQWPERLRHGRRLILLRGAGVLSFPDAAAFDAWAQAGGRLPGWIERWQLSWKLALMSLAMLLVLLGTGWRWGLPWASDQVVAHVPLSAEQPIGDEAMALIDEHWLQPSRLGDEEQRLWRTRFDAMLGAARNAGMPDLPERLQLHFRRAAMLGPNAFALPGGQMCVTDELIELMKNEPDAVMTILAHEVGHVRHRHGLRLGLRAGVVAAVTALWLGDYSSMLNGLPVVLTTNAYSRDHEREADAFARELARRGGVNPARIAAFFERIQQKYGDHSGSALAIAFSTHPADGERIAFFKAEGASVPKN